ncbi:MAG: nucleotidyltransferase domain-containing protein [archaeon]
MRAEDKVFSAFHESRQAKLYFSQIKDATKLSNSSLQNALEKLEKNGLIKKEETKANTFYILPASPATHVRFAQLDILRFDNLHRNIRLPLIEFIKNIPRSVVTVLLFGSAARKTEEKKSDIDILIVLHSFSTRQLQKHYEQEMLTKIENARQDAQAISLHRISTAITTTQQLREDKDHLLIQARDTGFPIYNQQQYYEVLIEH